MAKETTDEVDEKLKGKIKDFQSEVSKSTDAKVLGLNKELINLQNDVQTIDTSVQDLRNDYQSEIGRLESSLKDGLKKANEDKPDPLTEM